MTAMTAAESPQSALQAAGPVAKTLLEVSGVLAVGGTLIFAAVMVLLAAILGALSAP